MAKVVYIIKVIEPDKEYVKTFSHNSLEVCKRTAQEYLWNCPEGTKYIYVNTRINNED